MLKLHGIFPPLATPFDHHGDLYKVKVQHNVEKWNLTGLAGYVVCGSTGESVYLTTEEKTRLWEWVAQYAAPTKLLIAGTGVESVRETVELTNRAAEIGYKAAMVRTPFVLTLDADSMLTELCADALENAGVEVVERVSADVEPYEHSEHYLRTKKEKMGHLFTGW